MPGICLLDAYNNNNIYYIWSTPPIKTTAIYDRFPYFEPTK